MEGIVLEAGRREVIGKKVKSIRREGGLPAILYGQSIDPIPVTLDYRDTTRTLQNITSSQLITINIEGDKYTVLVRDRQRHPVRGDLLHIDFMVVSMTEKLRANVLIELSGEAPAVKEVNGMLVTGLEGLDVESLPGDLPERVVVDISSLEEIGQGIYVKDLKLPDGVELLTDADEMIVLVTSQVIIEEEEEEVEEVLEEELEAEPEVIERGKKEEEEEE